MTNQRVDNMDDKKCSQDRIDYLKHLRVKLLILDKRCVDVARATGFHKSYVTHVLNGRKFNKKIIQYIENLPDPKTKERN